MERDVSLGKQGGIALIGGPGQLAGDYEIRMGQGEKPRR